LRRSPIASFPAGLLAVKMRGGLALVQDPAEAAFPQMPDSAKRYVQVDYSLPLSELGPMLVKLCQKFAPQKGETVMSYPSDHESELVRQDIAALEAGQKSNQPIFMVCPECGGSLWELRDGAFKKFQCRVGHRYSLQAALAEQRQQVERVLWVAVRTLEEQASLSREVANL
jgi:two-component system, chemotaxis family, protein-glutamate methylesterase/glutaminase